MASTARKPPERIRAPIARIKLNPKNSNVVSDESMAKLERNIVRTGHYPPFIVRPLKDDPDHDYLMLDGEHRSKILTKLGILEADVEVWHVTEREGDVMLATLNTLRGTDDLRLRAALIDSLSSTIPIDQLAGMLPEDVAGIEDLLKLQQVDLDALEAQQRQAAEKGDDAPQPLHFLLFPDQYVTVRNALDHIKAREDLNGKKNADGQALFYMAVEYLSGVGWDDAQAAIAAGEPPIGSQAPPE